MNLWRSRSCAGGFDKCSKTLTEAFDAKKDSNSIRGYLLCLSHFCLDSCPRTTRGQFIQSGGAECASGFHGSNESETGRYPAPPGSDYPGRVRPTERAESAGSSSHRTGFPRARCRGEGEPDYARCRGAGEPDFLRNRQLAEHGGTSVRNRARSSFLRGESSHPRA